MKDLNIIYYICWIASLLLIGENITKSAIKNITHFHILHEDVLVLIALILGIMSHHPIGSMITLILYMLSEPYRIKLLEQSFQKINHIIDIPEMCLKYENNQTKEVLLSSLKINDILIIEKDMTIPVNGIIMKGESLIDTYPLSSSYELISVKENDEVHSGEINKGGTIYIKVTSLYQSSHLSKIIEIASKAPIYQSKAELFIYKFSYYYTPIVVVIALIMAFMILFMNKNISEYLYISSLLFMISGSFIFEQSASLSMLTGFAKAFKEGIIIESSYSLDAINGSQMIIYDTIDNQDINQEELELLNKLNHIGKSLIVFNDSQKELVGDYKIYNQLTSEQKQDIIDQSIVDVVYIGDSQKDIQCFQKSMVAISRGGISDSKIVENSDIILIDHSLDKVYKIFKIARNVREKSLFDMIFSFVVKLIFIILILAKFPIHLWMIILCEAILTYISLYIAVR
jgi:cation transport ATPase